MTKKISKNWPRCLFSLLTIFTFIVPVAIQAVTLENPLGNINDVGSLMVRVITFILRALGIFGVFMVIYGGFLFLIAGGNEETIKKAKATLVWAVIGIAIILCSRIIVGFVATTLNPEITTSGLGDIKVSKPGAPGSPGKPADPCLTLGKTCTDVSQLIEWQKVDRGCENPVNCPSDYMCCFPPSP